jgi:hypothetical protein
MTLMQSRLSAFSLLLILAGALSAGELDPSQDKWFKQYQKQPNVPKPAEMLLNTDAEPKLSDKAVSLFNGKDLTGWKICGGESKFDVTDGCIRAVCKPDSPSTYLCTEKEDYADFLLTFETKFLTETNSGIMVRAQAKGQNGNTVFGPQVEHEPYTQGRGWSGGIYGQDCGGWFYPVWLKEHAETRKAQHLKKADEWNRVTILAKGETIKTWLNGVPVAHWKTDTYKKGYFGLQMHKGKEGEVLWRDLKLQLLAAE